MFYNLPDAGISLVVTTAGDGDATAATFPLVKGDGVVPITFTGTWASGDTLVLGIDSNVMPYSAAGLTPGSLAEQSVSLRTLTVI